MLSLVTSLVLTALTTMSSTSCIHEEEKEYCSQKLARPSCYTQQCPSMPVEDTMKRFDLIMKGRVWGQHELISAVRRKVHSHLLHGSTFGRAPAVFHFVGRCRSGKTRMAESVGAALSSRKIGNKDCASVTIQGDHFIGMSMKEARTEMRDILRKQLLVTERSVFILNDMQKFAELPLIIEMVVMGTMFDTDAEVSLRRSIVIITSDFGKEGASDTLASADVHSPGRWQAEKERIHLLADEAQRIFTNNAQFSGKVVLFPFGSALDEEHAYPELFAFLLKRDVLCKLPCTLTGSWGFRTCRRVTFSFEMDDLEAAMVKWRLDAFDGTVESLTVQGFQHDYVSGDLKSAIDDSVADADDGDLMVHLSREVRPNIEWDISVTSTGGSSRNDL